MFDIRKIFAGSPLLHTNYRMSVTKIQNSETSKQSNHKRRFTYNYCNEKIRTPLKTTSSIVYFEVHLFKLIVNRK